MDNITLDTRSQLVKQYMNVKKILAKCSVTERITLTAGNLFTKVNYHCETLAKAMVLLNLTGIAQQPSSS